MDSGYRPVKRMANQAMIVLNANAIQRNTSTKMCGMTRNHLTSHIQFESWGSSSPYNRAG